MESNELQIVTFEQAKRLKVAGFDWETDKYYDHEFYFEAPFDNHNDSQCFFSAPTVALALKGFRDVKEYVHDISIRFFIRINTFKGSTAWAVLNIQRTDTVKWSECGQHDTYENAESALLNALLNRLEDK